MRFLITLLLVATGALLAPIVVRAADAVADSAVGDLNWDFPAPNQSRWGMAVTTGFDAFVHTFPLATTDTTETIAEYMAQAGIEGRSDHRARHRWSLRAESSIGTQLFRERLEAGYRLVDDQRKTRLRLDGSLWGRQYRRETEYSLSSDNFEGRFSARTYPYIASAFKLEARGWTAFQRYDTPSTLEVNHREDGLGAFIRSQGLGSHLWHLGTRGTVRTHPDSTRIDRLNRGLEGGYEYLSFGDAAFRLYHRSDRRVIEDETVRPSAWIHWSDLDGFLPAGPGRVFCELQSEVWRYDEEMSAFFDSWRVDGYSGFGWGEVLATRWRVGLATERLEAGDSPETYSQFGLRTGVEAYDSAISGSLTIEFGQRLYDAAETDTRIDSPTLSADDAVDDYQFRYSDFTYWEIWLMGAWTINDHFSLDLLANYQPERHTESIDDSALGFGSVRLVWKP